MVYNFTLDGWRGTTWWHARKWHFLLPWWLFTHFRELRLRCTVHWWYDGCMWVHLKVCPAEYQWLNLQCSDCAQQERIYSWVRWRYCLYASRSLSWYCGRTVAHVLPGKSSVLRVSSVQHLTLFKPGGIDGTPANEPVPDGGTINGIGQYADFNSTFFNITLEQ